jgi:outer membrane protein assembly factor BamB
MASNHERFEDHLTMTKHCTLPRILLLCSTVCFGNALACAADWPRFRGPNGTGIATDSGIPIKWTEKDGVLWKTPIPGAGNSSPIISGNRIFLETALGDGGDRQMVCVNSSNGNILWATPIPGGKAKKHQKNSFASSTPATDGQRIYGVFWDGQKVAMVAFDFEGKIHWTHDFGNFTSQHGVGASPIVFEDKVYLNNDQDKAASLVALNAKSGDIAWEATRRPFRASYSTPYIAESGGKPELIVASTAGIASYDPHTGKVNWDWVWNFTETDPLRTVGSPVACKDLIVLTGGEGPGGARHMVAVRTGGAKPDLAWELKKLPPYVSTALVQGDQVFFVNDAGIAGCLDGHSGKTIWADRLDSGSGTFTASPILINGNIYAVNEAGVVYVFKAAAKLELLGKSSIGEPVMATPAVANNRLFIRGKEHLFCIGKQAKEDRSDAGGTNRK